MKNGAMDIVVYGFLYFMHYGDLNIPLRAFFCCYTYVYIYRDKCIKNIKEETPRGSRTLCYLLRAHVIFIESTSHPQEASKPSRWSTSQKKGSYTRRYEANLEAALIHACVLVVLLVVETASSSKWSSNTTLRITSWFAAAGPRLQKHPVRLDSLSLWQSVNICQRLTPPPQQQQNQHQQSSSSVTRIVYVYSYTWTSSLSLPAEFECAVYTHNKHFAALLGRLAKWDECLHAERVRCRAAAARHHNPLYTLPGVLEGK